MAYYAYIHCKPDGSPFYVGKGNERRVKNLQRKYNPWHSNVLKKYGAENISVGAYECSSEEISLSLEVGLIKRLRIMGVKLTNLTDGGEGVSGLKMSEDAREKMRLAKTGKSLSEEHKEKLRIASTGKVMSPESREKCRVAKLGRPFTEDHKKNLSLAKTGFSPTEECRKKLSNAISGRVWVTNGEECKMVKSIDALPDGWKPGRFFVRRK